MTARQAYWLSCVVEACANVEQRTGHPLPVSQHEIAKVDRARHHGVSSTSAGTLSATLLTLSERRWIEIGIMPPELRAGDRRHAHRAYQLVNRAAINADVAQLAELRAAREKLLKLMAQTRGNLNDPRMARASDEVDYARQRGELVKIDAGIVDLVAKVEAHAVAPYEAEIEVPPALLPANQLLASCETKAPQAARTPNPYAE